MSLRKVSVAVVAGLAVSACSMFGGDGKYAPDEFEVVDRAPLVIPPESELRPPRPGEPRAQEINPGQQAYEALFPGKKVEESKPKSNGEVALLRNIGGSEPDIRSNVAQKDLEVVKKTLMLAEILDAGESTHQPDNVTVKRTSSN